jgi:hypothetical protein
MSIGEKTHLRRATSHKSNSKVQRLMHWLRSRLIYLRSRLRWHKKNRDSDIASDSPIIFTLPSPNASDESDLDESCDSDDDEKTFF